MNRTAVDALAATARRQTAVVLGGSIVLLLWLGVFYKDFTDRTNARLDAEHTEQAYATMFEENVLRAIGEIDKTLLYMRRLLEGGSQAELYRNLATTHDLLSDIIVQVAVMDSKGILRATNAGPQPPPPTDLSDRPHFKVHAASSEDTLYIGEPLIGRASNRMSVQFSRGFHGAGGGFGGVVVASLDPYHFASFLDRIDLGMPAAVSLIGKDGIVRSDGGQDDGLRLGDNVVGTAISAALESGRNGTLEAQGRDGRGGRLVALQKVSGQPLWVLVSISEADIFRDVNSALVLDGVMASLLTFLIIGVVVKLRRMENRRRAAEAEVRRSALRDPLTDLPNRRVLQTELEDAIAEARRADDGRNCALLLLDLDRFKVVNDTLGHGAGDQLLIEVSRRLSAAAGSDNLFARLGGDEFAVVMRRGGTRKTLSDLAERLGAAAMEPYDIDHNRVTSAISIGIAVGPQDGGSVDDLMVAADLALYSAKATARGGHCLYDPSMKEGLTRRHQLETDLRQALEEGALSLHFQPSISVATGRITSFEALARWHHPVHGFVSPAVFIALAEETGLICDLGRWAVREACRTAATWPEDIRVAVNLSPLQLRSPGIVAVVAEALDDAGLPAHRLEMEITEQILLGNSEHNRQVLQSLKGLGVSIAMDDFGTGYSSLNYLHAFPFDRIKVDQAFVAKLGQNPRGTALVRAVIDIARSFGMSTTAEGVETAEQRDILTALGCTDIQGYLYARPMLGPDVLHFIAGWREKGGVAA